VVILNALVFSTNWYHWSSVGGWVSWSGRYYACLRALFSTPNDVILRLRGLMDVTYAPGFNLAALLGPANALVDELQYRRTYGGYPDKRVEHGAGPALSQIDPGLFWRQYSAATTGACTRMNLWRDRRIAVSQPHPGIGTNRTGGL
jgi:hypothetical protein